MPNEVIRARSTDETRQHIIDVARETLGQDPEAGMGDIASAAGVVRRTVYGHFRTRADLVRTLAQQAADEMTTVLAQVDRPNTPVATVWKDFVTELWPLAHRYRVLLAMRRGEYGEEIHALLRSVDARLTNLVRRGQDNGNLSTHLPAHTMSQIALGAVFAVAFRRRDLGAQAVRELAGTTFTYCV